jgi:hypothetical protein
MLGKTCSPEDTSTASCTGALAFGCAGNACSGTSAIECAPAGTRMLDRGFDCAGYGAGKCAGIDGGLVCAPGTGAPSCAADKLPACDGTTASSCAGGREIRVECTLIGLPCDVSEPISSFDPAAACIKRGAGACTGADVCNGDTLQSCGRGTTHELNCSNVGLGKCAIGANGRAACARP